MLSNAVFSYDTGNGQNCFRSAAQQFSQGWYDNVVAVDPTNPDRVFIGGIDIWRSDNAGSNTLSHLISEKEVHLDSFLLGGLELQESICMQVKEF